MIRLYSHADLYDPDRDSNPYEAAVREWIARRVRSRRGYKDWTRHQIRNVRFGMDGGWGGTEVTPGDPDYICVSFELQAKVASGGWSERDWRPNHLGLEGVRPSELVAECLAIAKDFWLP